MGHTTSKGRGRDLNLGLWGSKKCSSQESAFPQLNAKILEGCGLRLFAASKCSPWPAPEKVTITAMVLSQVVGGCLGWSSKPLSRGTRILLWAERHTWWERLGWLGAPCWGELVRPGLSCSPRRWCVVWWEGGLGCDGAWESGQADVWQEDGGLTGTAFKRKLTPALQQSRHLPHCLLLLGAKFTKHL